MKKLNLLLVLLTLAVGCNRERIDLPDNEIVIMFENDVHCAVDNYAAFAARRSEFMTETPYIATVSSGDFVQGDLLGGATRGESIIKILNHVGYDFVTLGNHEFDYGIPKLFELTSSLNAEVINCNFVSISGREPVFSPYAIKRFGDTDVAFLGITTPRTMISAPRGTFNDENGNLAYDLSGETLNELTQKYVDEVRKKGADYVVVLSHLGDVVDRDPNTSLTLIQGTSGIDVVLDAHAHNVIPGMNVQNKEGKNVVLTSTGKNMPVIGALEISTKGEISVNFVETASYQPRDKDVQAFVDKEKDALNSQYEKVIAHSDFPLVFKENGIRLARVQETPLGNLIADALCARTNLEVAVLHSSNIKAGLEAGDIKKNDVLNVNSYLNKIVTANVTGQQLLDGLEMAVSYYPAEDGAFLQVSGLKFEFDSSITADFILDENERLVRVADGSKRRVSNVMILENGSYSPVDPSKTYTIAGLDFIFINKGCTGEFQFVEVVEEIGVTDFEAVSDYIEFNLGGVIPERYRQPEGRIVRK